MLNRCTELEQRGLPGCGPALLLADALQQTHQVVRQAQRALPLRLCTPHKDAARPGQLSRPRLWPHWSARSASHVCLLVCRGAGGRQCACTNAQDCEAHSARCAHCAHQDPGRNHGEAGRHGAASRGRRRQLCGACERALSCSRLLHAHMSQMRPRAALEGLMCSGAGKAASAHSARLPVVPVPAAANWQAWRIPSQG